MLTAQARKTAADRASALALAQSATSLNGSYTSFSSLNAQSTVSSNPAPSVVQTDANFGSCNDQTLPRFAGSCQITSVTVGKAILATGN